MVITVGHKNNARFESNKAPHSVSQEHMTTYKKLLGGEHSKRKEKEQRQSDRTYKRQSDRTSVSLFTASVWRTSAIRENVRVEDAGAMEKEQRSKRAKQHHIIYIYHSRYLQKTKLSLMSTENMFEKNPYTFQFNVRI